MTAISWSRRLVAGLLVAAAVGAVLVLRPETDTAAIARIELAQGREQLVLQQRRDTGSWVIASAHDAPGDPARIAALVEAALALEAKASAPVPLPAGEPLELRLTAPDDRIVRHLALWPGIARELPDGAPFASPMRLPSLAPAAWSTLRPPAIDPATFLAVSVIRPEGTIALDEAGRAALAADISRLGAAGWVPARQLDWTGAVYVQATRADGTIIEIQRLTRADGRRFLRFTSDRDPALRAVRFFAFEVRADA